MGIGLLAGNILGDVTAYSGRVDACAKLLTNDAILILVAFWATICKMVCPMLSDHCPNCVSVCLSVLLSLSTLYTCCVCQLFIKKLDDDDDATLVYCGQMVGWIKMPPGMEMEVGLGSGHIVFHGDPAPPSNGKGHRSPHFRNLWMQACLHLYKPRSVC